MYGLARRAVALSKVTGMHRINADAFADRNDARADASVLLIVASVRSLRYATIAGTRKSRQQASTTSNRSSAAAFICPISRIKSRQITAKRGGKEASSCRMLNHHGSGSFGRGKGSTNSSVNGC